MPHSTLRPAKNTGLSIEVASYGAKAVTVKESVQEITYEVGKMVDNELQFSNMVIVDYEVTTEEFSDEDSEDNLDGFMLSVTTENLGKAVEYLRNSGELAA